VADVKRHQDLIAWQRGMSLCREVYKSTNALPDSERFGLQSQMRRAAVSIPSNIAEGFGRQATADLIRFLRMARGSLFELQTQFQIAVDLKYINEGQVPADALGEADRVLQGLIRSLENRSTAQEER